VLSLGHDSKQADSSRKASYIRILPCSPQLSVLKPLCTHAPQDLRFHIQSGLDTRIKSEFDSLYRQSHDITERFY